MNVCTEPGCPTLIAGRRCPVHAPGPERGYDRAHQCTSRRLITEHLAAVGAFCPGWDEREPHDVDAADLVADHIEPGYPDAGYVVRCRSCNSARGGGLFIH